MPAHQAHADDEPSARQARHQLCLYLLAEAERIIDRAATDWTCAEIGLVTNRLTRLVAKLTPMPTPPS